MTRPIGFSLGTWMAIVTVFSVIALIAFVADNRSRGSEALVTELHGLRGGDEHDDEYPEAYPPDAWNDDASLWTVVSGYALEVPEGVDIYETEIDAQTARQLKRTKAAENIEFVSFYKTEIDEDAAFFPASWKCVKRIRVIDTKLPNTWRDGLAGDSEHVIAMAFSGRNGLELEDYLKLGHLKLLWIRDGDLDQASVAKLKNELPNTRVIVLPEDPEAIRPTGPPLSRRNASEVERMRDAFSRLRTAAANAGLGESDYQVVDSGWTEEQIVAFERSLGIAMHKSVRAYLEVQAGRWLRDIDPLFWDWSEKQWQPQDLISRDECGYRELSEDDVYDDEEPGLIPHELLKVSTPYFVAAFPLDEHNVTFAIDLETGEYLRRGYWRNYWIRMPGKTIYDHLDYYTDLAGRISEREEADGDAKSISYFEATEPRTYRAPIGDYSGGYMARQCNH
ncbi:hypothetical protein N9L06_06305 [Mariniblastus sp.]|nr:hypothetical protein [Mariniblastus sp.]